jgi:C-terminal processing protease CtpA/Prc
MLTACGSNTKDDLEDILFPGLPGSENNNNNNDSNQFSLAEKKFVHNLFLTEYLWYDDVSQNIDYTSMNTPQLLINNLVTPKDKWSFTMTKKEYENYVNQKTSGFGFGYRSQNDFTIYIVRIDAPAWGKLYRGDTIVAVNGQAVSQQNIAQASANAGQASTFTVVRAGQEVTVSLTPSNYTFKVSLGKVIQHNTKNIGYLRYDSFTDNSVAEFEKIFTTFKEANIQELIIDLRYNGGGSIQAASNLLDNITNAYPNKRQVYLDWNANYTKENSSYTFEGTDLQDGNELTMQRVIFLVSQNSASASELVISALEPYLTKSKVVTIGTKTHGKPVGMSGKAYGNNYYFLINFLVKNDASQSTSFDGIPATCAANDDLTFLRGDVNGPMLKTALHYIDTNSCL